jgi:hypothetical protein
MVEPRPPNDAVRLLGILREDVAKHVAGSQLSDRFRFVREHKLFELVRDLWGVRAVLGRIKFVSGGEGFALSEAYEITGALDTIDKAIAYLDDDVRWGE